MLTTIFGDIQSGRLQRLPYLGYYLAIVLLILLAGVGIGASIGLAERTVGGDLAEAQQLIAEKFGLIGLVLIVVVFAVLLFAQLNIAAKRVRDIGLAAPWLVLLGVFILVGAVSRLVGPELAGILNLVVFLALLLIPTGALGKVSGSTGA